MHISMAIFIVIFSVGFFCGLFLGSELYKWNVRVVERLFSKLFNPDVICNKAPNGWQCTRDINHEGPCAAKKVKS
jgi:hypothetical protein